MSENEPENRNQAGSGASLLFTAIASAIGVIVGLFVIANYVVDSHSEVVAAELAVQFDEFEDQLQDAVTPLIKRVEALEEGVGILADKADGLTDRERGHVEGLLAFVGPDDINDLLMDAPLAERNPGALPLSELKDQGKATRLWEPGEVDLQLGSGGVLAVQYWGLAPGLTAADVAVDREGECRVLTFTPDQEGWICACRRGLAQIDLYVLRHHPPVEGDHNSPDHQHAGSAPGVAG